MKRRPLPTGTGYLPWQITLRVSPTAYALPFKRRDPRLALEEVWAERGELDPPLPPAEESNDGERPARR